ncbi:uncharacterized protein LOC100845260 isoform X2 [Brachypodium distachyon]|uniref:F-box domain-containing protein n=1 Tax=Brachypodium distachyon TaxID=15368 RepID=A0A0Q3GNR7_BRADI|nr:uncharacterized protein LOC100845260 isoform X2 [Brachypodium distachyon]KQJ82466.1 hypothetical protein BRADI_5g09097v3 [Brachypodium distachyon]|eukprot:XP_003581189.1 uncharacterized protein LOC100845260 isoform X2 [Brachypodium distachyon]
MSRRHRSAPPLPAVFPPLDDDCIWEILLRLPPQPSFLLRASLVCKRWRCLVTNPKFLSRFSAHHRRPPLLGFFSAHKAIFFVPALDPPDWIPAPRFSLRPGHGDRFQFLDCRHGRALILSHTQPPQIVVWDPFTGEQIRVAAPPAFSASETLAIVNGAVLCAAGDHGHLHGDCRSRSFRVVLGAFDIDTTHAFACVYSSEGGVWGDVASLPILESDWIKMLHDMRNFHFQPEVTPMVLVGDSLYWLLWQHMPTWYSGVILKIDLQRQSIAVVKSPPDVNGPKECAFTIVPGEDGCLGLILMSYSCATLWNRRVYTDGDAIWVPGRTIQLDKLLSLGLVDKEETLLSVGFAEQNNVMLVRTCNHVFMVYLRSMKFKKLCHSGKRYFYHPFESFYSPGNGIDDGHGETGVL